jgi:hypothetical protein
MVFFSYSIIVLEDIEIFRSISRNFIYSFHNFSRNPQRRGSVEILLRNTGLHSGNAYK